MWHSLLYFLKVATGAYEPGAQHLTIIEMAGRGVFGFIALLLVVRLGRRRLMSRIGPFDLLVTMLIGSTLSRGITGNTPLLATIGACAAIIAVHWIIAALAARSNAFSAFVEGLPLVLLRDGQPERRQMRRHGISEHDLLEALRTEGKKTNLTEVKLATLERSGSISMITDPSQAARVHDEQGIRSPPNPAHE
jgi:uncharacterized membrane protein YcaP (DUF421 family)